MNFLMDSVLLFIIPFMFIFKKLFFQEVIQIDLTGRILKSRYCILEKISEGGEGSVYLARDMELGTLWAVKQIPAAHKRESKLLRLFSHPSMPKMIDYVEKDEYCYIIMEFIQGKTLEWYISRGEFFSPERVIQMGNEIAGILSYLHDRKPPVYYGDLKPENLMLTESGRLYLVDFGSAVFGYTKEQKVCLGTIGYAAPEQYEGKVGKTSDVFALGKTLERLLGGKKWRMWISHPRLLWVLHKCCIHEEKYRYPDMGKAIEALAWASKGKRGTGKMLLAGLAGAGIVLAAGGLFLYQQNQPEFLEALTKATQFYYEDAFQKGSWNEQKEICQNVEEKLQRLLRIYKGEDEQKRVLLLLAANSEYQGDAEQAEFYYEQLLLYQPQCQEVYGDYGLFLWQQGEEEKSVALWKEYENMMEEEKLTEEEKLAEEKNLTDEETLIDEKNLSDEKKLTKEKELKDEKELTEEKDLIHEEMLEENGGVNLKIWENYVSLSDKKSGFEKGE